MSFLRSLARRPEMSMSRIGRRVLPGVREMSSSITEDAVQHVAEQAKFEREHRMDPTVGAKATATLLGVPLGQTSSFLDGPSLAPSYIRRAIFSGNSRSITSQDGTDLLTMNTLADVGDLPIQELRHCKIEGQELMDYIRDSVKNVLTQNPLRPLVLGGKQSVSLPVVQAIHDHYGLPVDILHFDARPDLSKTSPNNPDSDDSTFARIIDGNYAGKLIQVGLRSMTEEERARGNDSRGVIEHYEMRNLAENHPDSKKLTDTLSKLGGASGHGVYISIDVCCLDPSIAPGVSHSEPGGLDLPRVFNILQALNNNIVGADVVGYNPKRDNDNRITASVVAKIVKELSAKMSKP